MSGLNGIYKASFAVGTNSGEGIVVLRDGYLGGGDPGFTYEGAFQEDGSKISGHLDVRQWNTQSTNVFAGLNNFSLDFGGGRVNDGIHATGTTGSAPGAAVQIVLHRLK